MLSSPSHPVLPPINSPPPLDIPVLGSVTPTQQSVRDPPLPTRPAHNNVLARLQALFPSVPHVQSSPSAAPSEPSPAPPPVPPKPLPKFVKVRILTWNMHDSLPKGDVEELLGAIPVASSSHQDPPSNDPSTLPVFPPDPEHPHHLVIVAGQECPSASGIPMAFGAGFKLNNKDNSRSRHSLLPPDSEEVGHRRSIEADILSPTLDKSHEHHHPPSSWSSILENWYCHPVTAPLAGAIASDLNIKTQHEAQKTGPYELLVKERMMGLYLAVFIHRDARPLVEATSRSAVTAGLIGGRVGNKGGVGVSVKLNGTTFLFINAHLAAHEGKVHHRLADLAKIKAELNVDDFLDSDDPRIMCEDITDRFDTTFIFGDLNFRLDVTRLHADWLIARKEYEQALEFDQLRKVMNTSSAFAGFKEAAIHFPPTFKYDVLRTIKRSRTKSFRRSGGTPHVLTPHEKLLTEVEEVSHEHAAEGTLVDEQATDDRPADEDRVSPQNQNGDDDVEPDRASIASSAWTSARSRRTANADSDSDDDAEDGGSESFKYSIQSPPASASTTHLMHKMWSAAAAHKAKQKWVALFNARSPRPITKSPPPPSSKADSSEKKRWRQSWASSKSMKSPGPERRGSEPPDLTPRTPVDPADPRQSKAGRAKELQVALLDAVHARPYKHFALSENNVDLEEEDKGVYDSSHKQRVPSWCDRILWKSTIIPESDSDTEDTESQRFMPLRARMGQIFHVFRPSSLRSRRDSTWSVNHPDLSTPGGETSPAVVDKDKRLPPIPPTSPTRGKAHPLRRLSQTRSVDSFQRRSSEERALTRIHSFEPNALGVPVPTAARGVPMRHANTISPVMPVGDASPPTLVSPTIQSSSPVDTTLNTQASTSPSGPMFRWLRPFFGRDGTPSTAPPVDGPSVAVPLPPPPPRRGDIVCLKYDTLDDRGMRRLEGRSDHRPVMGSYAVYI